MFKLVLVSALLLPSSVFANIRAKSFIVKDLNELILTAKTGNIVITERDDDRARIEAEQLIFEIGCRLEMAKFEDKLVVEVRTDSFVGNDTCKVNFKIQLPSHMALKINHGAGDLSVSGNFANIYSNVGSGDTVLRYANAPKSGKLKINTGSGNVTVFLPKSSAYQGNLKAALGNLTNEIAPTMNAKFRISMHSGTGNVNIKKAQ